jgi:hypothetical protein
VLTVRVTAPTGNISPLHRRCLQETSHLSMQQRCRHRKRLTCECLPLAVLLPRGGPAAPWEVERQNTRRYPACSELVSRQAVRKRRPEALVEQSLLQRACNGRCRAISGLA